MIDNYEQAMALIQKMFLYLPIPVRVSKALFKTMRKKGVQIPSNREMEIEKVFYMGDEGGIGCGLRGANVQNRDEALVVSLTHLSIRNNHPLAQEIRAYQKERTRKLAGSDKSFKSKSVKPKQVRRKR